MRTSNTWAFHPSHNHWYSIVRGYFIGMLYWVPDVETLLKALVPADDLELSHRSIRFLSALAGDSLPMALESEVS